MKSVQTQNFFQSVFFCIRTKYDDLLRKSPHSARMKENADQKKTRIWRTQRCSKVKTVFYSIHYKHVCLVASDLFHVFARLIKFYTLHYRGIRSTDVTAQKMKFSIEDFTSKCDQIRRNLQIWSVTFAEEILVLFILTLENVFQRFHVKGNRKRIGFSKNRYYRFSKQPSVSEIGTLSCDSQQKF